jgi:hypothetical protein
MRNSASCGFPSGGDLPREVELWLRGPTIAVDIGFDLQYGGSGVPNVGGQDLRALVDTGSRPNFVDLKLAKSLDLVVVDEWTISGSNGKHLVDVFLAHLYVPSLGYVRLGKFGGIPLSDGDHGHLVLLGREFLKDFTLSYEGTTGEAMLTFMPLTAN